MATEPVLQEQNAEELLEQAQTPTQNLDHTSTAVQPTNNGGDPDAQATVITSLRSQIQDLFSQVTQLNSKLVQSYDRVADLEDNLHVASSNIRQSSITISQLELERTQHLAALNTGLLVEKSHVTAELTRLMEKATEEAAQRGQAETARADIEKDLDDLSATLFDQANTMVAEARFARAQSERKVEDAERALKGAEEAVGIMQQQMQEMQAEKEKSERSMDEMRVVMGKGKWVDKASSNGILSPVVRLRSSHVPYQEFLLFVAHLRTIRPSSSSPPAISTLLPLPFLARLLSEDSDPTVRLDLAPSLNWLSRRSVLSAIHAGQLTIEPMTFTNLLQESSSSSSLSSPIISSSNSSNANISCALCGASIFEPDTSHTHTRPPAHPLRTNLGLNANSWSTNIFKNPRSYSATNSANNSPPSSPNRSTHPLPNVTANAPQQVYIFRLAPTSSTSNLAITKAVSIPMTSSYMTGPSTSSHTPPHPSAHPSTQLAQGRNSQSTIYPLCTSGWCLARLRSTCSLWAFVRTGVIEKIWEEEVSMLPSPPPKSGTAMKSSKSDSAGLSKPPLPPRRRGLWGMASVLGERAASWSEGDKGRTPDKEVDKKLIPPSPPPVAAKPPPLPKRAVGRSRSTTASRAASPAPPVEELEPKSTVNGHSESADAEHVTVEKSEVLAGLDSAETVFCSADAHETKPESAADPISSKAKSSPPADNPAPETSTASPLSSPIDRRISQDSFASAASEIAPSEADTPPDLAPTEDKPAIAPQPESPSRRLSLNPPRTPTQATNNISVPSSPSNGLKDDPRTASPAPPPLPRRAAARLRPSSIVPPFPPAAPLSETKDGADAIRPPNGETVETKEHAIDSPTTANELTKEAAASEEERDLAGSPTTVHVVDEAETRKVSVSPMPTNEAEKMAENLGTSSQTPTINGDNVNSIVLCSSNPPVSKTSEGADSEVFIGDATWEERTWKELVRLKEEMFWARIGGLR